MNKEQAKDRIIQLIDKFSLQIDYYKSSNYNETQTRRDFIDPFFAALGWDIDNEKQQLETYRDVRHEDKIKINGHTKAPDYSFNINGKRKFFIEAKKPSVSIKDNPEPALQVRNYGWNAKLNISIVIDFEEFAIYDCTKKIRKNDKSNSKRLKYIYYTDYLKEFDFIWDTFAYENVVNDSIEKFAKNTIDFKTAEPVDKEFLQSLNNWREYLATTIALRNKELDEYEINFAVQQTIDRIVFLRVCEDRKIEREGYLQQLIKSKGNIYQNLFAYFQTADQKYNSGLFDFQKDKITKLLEIDNKVIKNIITELYETGYNFAVMPVEILGYAYEQFLGKVIRLTQAHHAIIEEKPEVRKAGGVYYTPDYIVNYIVQNTVGKLIENRTPEEISKIKILDPSCGSGSFLLGAYQYLLDYHLFYYHKNQSNKKLKENPLTADNQLTSKEKKRILLNNIYGVDIDTQAVEVTKLSLLLKALEGENETSIQTSLQLFNERVLPTIDNNIQSGNSLIGSDFYTKDLFITPKEERRINVFDWQIAFPNVYKQNGFDCIIGNPPYFRIDADKPETNYLRSNYQTPEFKTDIYTLFIEKFINQGFCKFGFIIPNTLMTNFTDKKLRKLILDKSHIVEIVNYKVRVFEQAVVHSMILILDNDWANKKTIVKQVENDKTEIFEIDSAQFLKNDNNSFDIRMLGKNIDLFEKIKYKSKKLESICEIKQAIKTGNDSKYVTKSKNADNFKPVIGGLEIARYTTKYGNRFVDYGKHLACPRDKHIFEVAEKILIRETGKRIIATYDNQQYYLLSSVYSVFLKPESKYNLKFVLGIINSTVSQYYMQQLCFDNSSGAFVKARIFHYKELPIPKIDFENKSEKEQHDKIVNLVENLLELYERLKDAKLQSDKLQIQRRIDFNEKEIDNLINKIYEFATNEIEIINNE